MAKIRIWAARRAISWRRPMAACLGLLMLAGLAGTAGADSDADPGDVVTFDLVLEDYQLSAGENVARVRQGDRVELRWQSDAAAAVHLHGYDIELHLHAGEMAVMAFEAEATGRFPVELHGGGEAGGGHHGGALLYVEVHPR